MFHGLLVVQWANPEKKFKSFLEQRSTTMKSVRYVCVSYFSFILRKSFNTESGRVPEYPDLLLQGCLQHQMRPYFTHVQLEAVTTEHTAVKKIISKICILILSRVFLSEQRIWFAYKETFWTFLERKKERKKETHSSIFPEWWRW